jgi:hypothetical protein
MPPKVPIYSEQQLRQVPLPNHGGRYAVVPHGEVIDEVKKQLQNANFTIRDVIYKMTVDGQVAQGIYYLEESTIQEMGMMFAWSNSYNKTMRFKCAIGAHVFVCGNGVLRGDMGNYSRKHSGTAKQDVINQIQDQITNAHSHYMSLVNDKQMLENVILTARDKGQILGELFANDEILTLTQVGIVKREIDKPSHNYNCDLNSAWTMYNHITLALKESHPSTYLKDHEKVHEYFVNKYGQLITVTTPSEPIIDNQEEPDFEETTVSTSAGSDFDIDNLGVNFL